MGPRRGACGTSVRAVDARHRPARGQGARPSPAGVDRVGAAAGDAAMTPATATPMDTIARARRRKRRVPSAPLAPHQIYWLAAMIGAAQMPHFVSVPAWVSVTGAALVALRLLLLH